MVHSYLYNLFYATPDIIATLMFQEIITPWIYLHQNRRGKETEKYEQHTNDLVTPAYVSYDIVVHVIRQSFLAFQVLFPFPPNVMLKLKYIPCSFLFDKFSHIFRYSWGNKSDNGLLTGDSFKSISAHKRKCPYYH